jgi:hypothetical protein
VALRLSGSLEGEYGGLVNRSQLGLVTYLEFCLHVTLHWIFSLLGKRRQAGGSCFQVGSSWLRRW